jgi:hypothetical protein
MTCAPVSHTYGSKISRKNKEHNVNQTLASNLHIESPKPHSIGITGPEIRIASPETSDTILE